MMSHSCHIYLKNNNINNLGFQLRKKGKLDRNVVVSAGIGGDSKKVVVVGSGWAGLGATWQLLKQGYEVDLIEANPHPGGMVAGWKSRNGKNVELGIHGYWYPYFNIFSLCNELQIQPFTDWTPSDQYSPHGLVVDAPIFQDKPRLPTPLAQFAYVDFKNIALQDRLSAAPLTLASADFDGSIDAWKRYDDMSALELFNQYGVSKSLYKSGFNPMLLVGLFAPGELCSAAATLGMLNFFILNHQTDFDVKWCRGTTKEMIFKPWIDQMNDLGNESFNFLPGHAAQDFIVDKNNVKGVIVKKQGGEQLTLECDAVIMCVGITGMKKIVQSSKQLSKRNEFRRVMNLNGLDVLAVRLWLDRRVEIPKPSNAVGEFEDSTGWTFFDLNTLHNEYRKEKNSVIEVDFYHANQWLPLSDEVIIQRVMGYLGKCIDGFCGCEVADYSVVRVRQGVTHFSPGSFSNMLNSRTSFDNLFCAGDWIVSEHGSFSQEKAYVTGLEAANLVIQQFGVGEQAQILPLEDREPHIKVIERLLQNVRGLRNGFL
eukprot:TRINITY_DN6713_c0_g1_i4.p1 TRINITY_DN6713_c0_g1~~TRINITY_DN6713_c0_g1_i4.p1  ORF type:complete len:540 (+),score=73.11 TRINITY_DN6713_c0_g1_i4:110-1729(+)